MIIVATPNGRIITVNSPSLMGLTLFTSEWKAFEHLHCSEHELFK